MKAKLLLLLLGIVAGVAAALLFPTLRERLLPESLRRAATEGTIADKRLEADRLLLTLVTDEGAVLATFSQRLPEIDLLVAPGDTVGLALDGYRPFVEDPEIVRVRKASDEPPDTVPVARPAVGSVADSTLFEALPELAPEARFCPSVALCVETEEVLVEARCEAGRVAGVTRSIDRYFDYVDAEACAACRALVENVGVEVRPGAQGYCRFDEYPRAGEVPAIESAVCVRDPEELDRFCVRDGVLVLDRWVHSSEIVPCDAHGPIGGLPADRVSCAPLRLAPGAG